MQALAASCEELRARTGNPPLHVGTNDVKGNKASKVMDDIDSLCQEIKETNPGVEITLSELTTREDNPEAKKTVTEVNTLFENYCTATNMYLIKHKNITDRSLNKSKLHLTNLDQHALQTTLYSFLTTAFSSTKDIQFPTFSSNFRTNSETVEVYDCPPDISPQISDNILNPVLKNVLKNKVLKTLKGFRVGHLNITSLVKHVDELRVYRVYQKKGNRTSARYCI